MSVRNLTNTTWDVVDGFQGLGFTGIYSVNYTYTMLGGQSYEGTNLFLNWDGLYAGTNVSGTKLYELDGSRYILSITITGGDDVTNSDLISVIDGIGNLQTAEEEQPTTPTKKFTRLFLGAIAHTSNGKRFRKLQDTEYVEPSEPEEPNLPVWNGTDLTGTTWEVPSVWSATSGYGLFSIDYKVSFKIPDMTGHSYYNRDRLGIGYNANVYPSTNSICFCREGYNTQSTMTGTTEYLKGCVMTFTITGGTDATNTKLIDWLKQYGTLTSHTMA